MGSLFSVAASVLHTAVCGVCQSLNACNCRFSSFFSLSPFIHRLNAVTCVSNASIEYISMTKLHFNLPWTCDRSFSSSIAIFDVVIGCPGQKLIVRRSYTAMSARAHDNNGQHTNVKSTCERRKRKNKLNEKYKYCRMARTLYTHPFNGSYRCLVLKILYCATSPESGSAPRAGRACASILSSLPPANILIVIAPITV